ncbi:MAG: DUF669 domain-containing protein [Nitrospirae bacterium]|nr:DUF669 domain-containing protein [Nitrospirota bacterium]
MTAVDFIEIDFTNVEEIDDFSPLPEGKYICELQHIDERQTRNGDRLWALKFKIVVGEYAGRFLFDNMVFSTNTLKRVKHICKNIGLDVSHKLSLSPALLIGRKVILDTVTDEYINSQDEKRKRSIVTYAGYNLYKKDLEEDYVTPQSRQTSQGKTEDYSEDSMPF